MRHFVFIILFRFRMKKLFPVLLLATALTAFFYFINPDGFFDDFLAKILRDGNYLFNLVNKENTIEKYVPPDLVELSKLGAQGQYIRQAVYDPLQEMLEGAASAGAPLKIVSAYRSFERQEQVFGYWSRRDPNANIYSAEPGHSEHQLGTTIDFGLGNTKFDLRWEFAGTAQGKWLEENARQYGFVMSYPKDKEGVTGYIYEPWHFRFIGKEAAKEWLESGLTLSEHLAAKPQYYRLIRRHDDYKVYSVDSDGIKHWVTTAEKFLEMGYKWEDVATVDLAEYNVYTEGGEI